MYVGRGPSRRPDAGLRRVLRKATKLVDFTYKLNWTTLDVIREGYRVAQRTLEMARIAGLLNQKDLFVSLMSRPKSYKGVAREKRLSEIPVSSSWRSLLNDHPAEVCEQ